MEKEINENLKRKKVMEKGRTEKREKKGRLRNKLMKEETRRENKAWYRGKEGVRNRKKVKEENGRR